MSSESDSYSTEDTDKKRKAVKGTEGFTERNKKTFRTPPKMDGKEDKLDKILIMMKDLTEGQNAIKQDIREIKKEQKLISSEIHKLKEENENLRKENEDMKKRNEERDKEVILMKNTMERIEKENKKNNVIITGLTMDTYETDKLREGAEKFIKQNLQVDVKIKSATKIGQMTCLIELNHSKDKENIMKNKSKLKNVSGSVYINEDQTRRERERSKILREIARTEKEKGKTVKIGYNKITINGEVWRWNKNSDKLEKLITKN